MGSDEKSGLELRPASERWNVISQPSAVGHAAILSGRRSSAGRETPRHRWPTDATKDVDISQNSCDRFHSGGGSRRVVFTYLHCCISKGDMSVPKKRFLEM